MAQRSKRRSRYVARAVCLGSNPGMVPQMVRFYSHTSSKNMQYEITVFPNKIASPVETISEENLWYFLNDYRIVD